MQNGREKLYSAMILGLASWTGIPSFPVSVEKSKGACCLGLGSVREHPNLEDFPKFGEIANFKIGEFPQIWRNDHFSILFLARKELSQYALIIHGRALV